MMACVLLSLKMPEMARKMDMVVGDVEAKPATNGNFSGATTG
jgi:hypothetical protein